MHISRCTWVLAQKQCVHASIALKVAYKHKQIFWGIIFEHKSIIWEKGLQGVCRGAWRPQICDQLGVVKSAITIPIPNLISIIILKDLYQDIKYSAIPMSVKNKR